MKLFITGATGFVGSEVVRCAISRGHEVVAAVRPATDPSGLPDGASIAQVDLRSPRGLAESLTGADSVIHLAAAKAGDFHTQFAGTVVATENLLTAMNQAGVSELVAISTFSVYDYQNIEAGSVLDEGSPIDRSPEKRDEYARTKLVQETLYRRFQSAEVGNQAVILRPGMIYGPNNLWHDLLGTGAGPRYLRVGTSAILPMTYVENCAEAMVVAAEKLHEPDNGIDGEVINIVDDNLPTQGSYAEAVAAQIETPPTITVPWTVVRLGADALASANRRFLDGRAKFPGIAVPDRLHARFKPLRFTNSKAKRLLGWTPRYGLTEAITRSVQAEASNRV